MPKSADAFRTISEVADWLGTPAHVLRFWESKFSQVRPVKRAGGRRYYRPADMELLGGIKRLLHEEGMTIKGVQKLLRDRGTAHVAAMSPPLDDLAVPLEAEIVQLKPRGSAPEAPPAPEAGPGPMTPPDGTEAGPAAAPTAEAPEDSAAPAPGHATAPAALTEAPETPEETPAVAQGATEEDDEDETGNLFSDLDDAPEESAADLAPVLPDLPEDPEDDSFAPAPGVLAALAARRSPLPAAQAARALDLARQLAALG
ncbi:MerR family transcriptional regulator [Pseudooceanicola sp. 200-1SW]|uniref:MerR family transcriptional regulator n=1 Tax=Pseudooceanicola sp. 200-1SW TaxID=3425949 RepID=UPI003D7F8039